MLVNHLGYDVIQPTDNHKREIVNCQSIGALAAFLESRELITSKNRASSITCDISDTEYLDFNAAMAIAKKGGVWETGAAKIAKIVIPTARVQRPKQRRRLHSSAVGFLPNVPAFLAGQPNAMLTSNHQPRPAKIIKVGVHVGRVWGVKQHQVLNRAVAIMAVIDELTVQSYAVEVWAVWRNEDQSGTAVEVNTLIKPSTAVWQPSVVAFALSTLAFQRRLCWGAAERLERGHHIAGGYGNGQNAPRKDMDVFFPYVVQGELFDTPEEAYKEVKKITDKEIAVANTAQ